VAPLRAPGERVRVLVAGAGIGGLTLALALRRRGIGVDVFERAPDAERVAVGGGLHLWPNGMRGLREAGVDDRVPGRDDAAAVLRRAEFWNARSRVLGSFDVAELERRLGQPTVGVVRAELQAMLAAELGDGGVAFGKEVAGVAEDGDGVTIRFADGDSARGDVLVGADGVHSTVRRHLHGDDPPRDAGYAAWQALAEPLGDDTPPGSLRVTFGPGLRVLWYHVGDGRLHWEAIVAGEGRSADFAALQERVSDWPSPTAAVLRATTGSPSSMDSYFRPPLRRWGRGRVTLLGDAAHAMTNAVAQGANMAIEDAAVLAHALSERPAVAALADYERRRRARTAQMTRLANGLAALARWEHPAAVRVRDALLARVFFGPIGSRMQARDLDYRFDG